MTVEFVSSKKRPFSNGSFKRLNAVKQKVIVRANKNKSVKYFRSCLTIAYNVLGIAEGGMFIISSLELKINRITKADKHFIDD
jgi:PBP1b-binding outer membrane lipoprotein LpoB